MIFLGFEKKVLEPLVMDTSNLFIKRDEQYQCEKKQANVAKCKMQKGKKNFMHL
jgi:hypothetical protein